MNSDRDAQLSKTSTRSYKCMYINSGQLRNGMTSLEYSSEGSDLIFVTEVLPEYNPDNISCLLVLFDVDGCSAFPS